MQDAAELESQKQKAAEKIRKKELRKEGIQDSKAAAQKLKSGLLGAGQSLSDRKAAFRSAMADARAMNEAGSLENGKNTVGAGLGMMVNLISDLAKQLENQIDEIASYKSSIDTRLQGSKNKRFMGSYWDQISQDIVGGAGVSPLVKQADIVSNVQSMVKMGIAFNVEQRAFLQTIKDKIAETFDANDSTLRRLIRIQQQDSTAARLGMESALNSFLNNMYETSEYLGSIAEGVRGSLEEAQALMTATAASELEFEVQKWLGSLYSVGMSQKGVSSIADAIGKIAAGDLSGLTGGGAGNLVIMAANEAGLSITDILNKGLTAGTANLLMEAMSNYLGN